MGLDHVEMTLKIEEEFGFEFPLADLERLRTFGEMTEYLLSMQAAASRAGSSARVLNREELEHELRQIVSSCLGVPMEKIRTESRFVEDLGAGR